MKTNLTRAALALIGSALVGNAFADEPKTDGQWRGSGAAAVSATSGNTSSTALLLTADAVRATEADKISLGGMVNYARAKVSGDTRTTSDKWAFGGQYDYNLSPSIFVFGKLGIEGDKMIDLSHRESLAGGAGYHVVKQPTMTFDVFGGVGYITDQYSSAQTIGDKTDTTFSRAALYVGEESSHKLSETTSFKQRLDVYPGLSGDKAVLAKFAAGLSVAMSGAMSLTVGVNDAYNSKPAVGLKKNDFGLFTGINVKFGAS